MTTWARLARRRWRGTLGLVATLVLAVACSGDSDSPTVVSDACLAQGVSAGFRFPAGDPVGHQDPQGARAAGQARAGRVQSGAQIRAPKNPRARIKVGDYLLANDKIAAYVGNEALSDGMSMFGGEILAIEPVGEDGLPRGNSLYGETLFALSRQVVAPETVTVLKDGSDGGEAVIRASGVLQNVAFLDPFRGFLSTEYNFPAAIDYVLRPGDDHITVRYSIANTVDAKVDFSRRENVGFFHDYTSQLYSASTGFGRLRGKTDFLAFAGRENVARELEASLGERQDDAAFAVRMIGSQLDYGAAVSGYQYFVADGLTVDACAQTTQDFAEVITTEGGLDGLLARMHEGPALAEHQGRVLTAAGEPLGDAVVHVLGPDQSYRSRTRTDAQGTFTVHAEAGSSVLAYAQGHGLSTPVAVAADTTVAMPEVGHLAFTVADAESGVPLPVRIQVIPIDEGKAPSLPETFGLELPLDDRIWQRFAVRGEAKLPVPPGRYRVIVSRGYEYELVDEVFEVAANQIAGRHIELLHSVDTRGVMCADFHIHTKLSFDSHDPVRTKVASAVADGLDIPVSSEHEWILDFQPTIEDLGLQSWAFGFSSEELTTFGFGHFGVVPIMARPELRNNGAKHWIGTPLPQVFHEVNALPERPVLIVNHPNSLGFQGYFSATLLDADSATSPSDQWSDDFEAIEVFNDSSFDENSQGSVRSWFSLLKAGKTFWGVGSSDSHSLRSSPVGYPRTCLGVGHDDPTALDAFAVRDVLRAGNATISGGIYLQVQGPGGEVPGQTVAGGGRFDVRVQAPSWVGVKELEVWIDGSLSETLPLGASDDDGAPGKRWQRSVQVASNSSSGRHWVVFHVRGEGDLAPLHPRRLPFAVSNPFFF